MSLDINMAGAKVNAAAEIFTTKGITAEYIPALERVGINFANVHYVLFDPDQATRANGSGVSPANFGYGQTGGSLSRIVSKLSSEAFNEIVESGRRAKRGQGRVASVAVSAATPS